VEKVVGERGWGRVNGSGLYRRNLGREVPGKKYVDVGLKKKERGSK